MKGIILAAGKCTSIYPITQVIYKPLLPIYDKPMIYYPLSALLLAGVTDILIIVAPDSIDSYKTLLGDGSQIGARLEYAIQPVARGIADAFIIGEDFIGDDSVCLVLGDNIFCGQNLGNILQKASAKSGATIFGYKVDDPREFGVVELDKRKNGISLEENPAEPKSPYAI
ncbi:MAG: NTP transferase domain-containing protein, partial [Clostridia bacterium]|nr:NTP transferase domain-containing protein [Clostridia bacterium]